MFFVYILASAPRGTLYIGITNDLVRRTGEHKSGAVGGFAQRYGVDRLVYYEWSESAIGAIAREKQMKKWRRAWKIRLVEENNPEWRDLFPEIAGKMDSRLRGNDDEGDNHRLPDQSLSKQDRHNAQQEN